MEKQGLNDSASVAMIAKKDDSPAKGSVIESKTFRDGLIYLYKRADFKKPTWLCRIKVPGTKGYINRSTKTGDEHQAFKFADDLYNQLHIKYLKGEAPVGKRIGPAIDAYIKRFEPQRDRSYFHYKILLMELVKPFLERLTFEELSTAAVSQLIDHLTTITKKGQLTATVKSMEALHVAQQLLVGKLAQAFRSLAPRVIAISRHFQSGPLRIDRLHARSIHGIMPTSAAIWANGRPLLSNSATVSRLNSGANTRLIIDLPCPKGLS